MTDTQRQTEDFAAALRREALATLKIIVKSYAPYDTHEAFCEAFYAYRHGRYDNPHDGIAGQAWDRGLEAAMRYERAAG